MSLKFRANQTSLDFIKDYFKVCKDSCVGTSTAEIDFVFDDFISGFASIFVACLVDCDKPLVVVVGV